MSCPHSGHLLSISLGHGRQCRREARELAWPLGHLIEEPEPSCSPGLPKTGFLARA